MVTSRRGISLIQTQVKEVKEGDGPCRGGRQVSSVQGGGNIVHGGAQKSAGRENVVQSVCGVAGARGRQLVAENPRQRSEPRGC